MCGIFGGTPALIAANADELLHHRGPDQHGHVLRQGPGGAPVVIGQTRLNVVYKQDVPTPMSRDGATIAFNGEIYNWLALRHELETRGHRFTTPTDTEVALCAFLEWGPACLERFNGMFALAVWHAGRLFLARDRLGKKPLFFAHEERGLGFASELKCFTTLDFAEVPICQALEFYFDEHTPFRNVRSLRPGEYAIWTPHDNALELHRWWTFPEPEPDLSDPGRSVDLFLDLFADACALRKLADVPVTLFLSGGVDSSLIQAMVGFPQTYTVQFTEFEDTIDERRYVGEFAANRGFEARIITPTRQDFFEFFGDMARFIEFPVGSQSVLPLFCLAREARRDGFVVALSGEGADELFNGYYRNELLLREEEHLAEDFAGVYATLCRRYFGTPLERFCRMVTRQGAVGLPLLLDFFGPRWRDDRSFAQNLARIETTIFLQPLLVMTDRLSMGNSLEVRNPFLDHRIVTFAARLTDDLKFRDGRGKWLLREALRRLVGPSLGIVNRPIKHGLPAPVNLWLFKSSAFDRKDWNQLFFGECLKQLASVRDPNAS
jgi:asparagine synthase (glutamine-hydrolysing)